jgi:phage terminase small subunit
MRPEHELFVANYLKTKNATKAARAAGYSEKSAHTQGSRLLKRLDISGAIAQADVKDEKKSKLAVAKAELSAARLLEEISHAALFDPGELYDEAGNEIPVHKLPEHVRRAIASIEQDKDYRKLRMVSKTTSQELLAKLAGWLKQENQNQQAVQIIIGTPAALPEPTAERQPILPVWE